MNTLYKEDFYRIQKEASKRSAREIIPLILGFIHPKSVVDVGCGLGTWLTVFKEFGITECLGIDGDYIKKNMLQIPQEEFLPFDLTKPLQLNREFDLVVSLEVAEHLPAECAEIFIDSVTKLGHVILFSAAIPFQGGVCHVNEQWPHYWLKYFKKNNYLIIDCLRRAIWDNENVEPYYAQNIFVFVKHNCIGNYPLLERELENTNISQLAIVHPKIYQKDFKKIAAETLPMTVEDAYIIKIEATEPVSDVVPHAFASRLFCQIEFMGAYIGTLELPICDGLVPAYVLSDAVAADFAWPIIRHFFERTIYRNIRIKHEPAGLSIYKEKLCLVSGLPKDERALWIQLHELIGWVIFLQEVWGCPNVSLEHFYLTSCDKPQEKSMYRPQIFLFEGSKKVIRYCVNNSWLIVEVSKDISDMRVSCPEINVLLTVGGAAVGAVTIPIKGNILRADELRAMLTKASGFELCRVAVREGILGKSATSLLSLRDRLSQSAETVNRFSKDGYPLYAFGNDIRALDHAACKTLIPDTYNLILGRNTYGLMGTSASRRTTLPAVTEKDIIDAALANGESIARAPSENGPPKRIIHSPDLIWHHLLQKQEPFFNPNISRKIQQTKATGAYHDHRNKNTVTSQLPILLYHRICPATSPATADGSITPETFEEHISCLHNAGFQSIRLEDWGVAILEKKPLPVRAILLTFDNGYLDFLTFAWPILRRYGFSATIFIVTDWVETLRNCDSEFGGQIPLLGWDEIRTLQAEGIEFGSHSASHRSLTKLTHEEIVREGARSRATLGHEIGVAVKAFSYPYGATNRIVQHLIGACGYIFGLTCQAETSKLNDSLLALPRIEPGDSDNLQNFIAKLDVHKM